MIINFEQFRALQLVFIIIFLFCADKNRIKIVQCFCCCWTSLHWILDICCWFVVGFRCNASHFLYCALVCTSRFRIQSHLFFHIIIIIIIIIIQFFQHQICSFLCVVFVMKLFYSWLSLWSLNFLSRTVSKPCEESKNVERAFNSSFHCLISFINGIIARILLKFLVLSIN